MDKQNILKHIERWLDIRQKNGYKNARIGFKGMEEIHLLMKNVRLFMMKSFMIYLL